MNARLLARNSEEGARPEGGFTLLEMVISVVLLTLITGAISAAFVSSLNATSATKTRVTETNDAQLIGAFFTRDAQAAGGTDPATGYANPSLGVTTPGVGSSFANGCTTPGTPIVGFKWIDQPSGTQHEANYSYVITPTTAGTPPVTYQPQQLLRTVCSTTAATPPVTTTGTSTLASNVVTTTTGTLNVPSAYCDNNAPPAANPCPVAFPNTVQMTITDFQNSAGNVTTPYTFTLTATLRPQPNASPENGSLPAPLILLGRNSCGPNGENTSGLGVEFSGGIGSGTAVNLHVFGKTYINTPDFSTSCPAMNLAANFGQVYQSDGGTYVLQGGHCNPTFSQTPCPTLTSYSPALTNPYAALDAIPPTSPPVSTALNLPTNSSLTSCNGNITPAIYTKQISVGIGATCTLAAGVYVFNAGVSISGGIFGFFPGVLQSATTGPNPGVLLYINGGQFNAAGNVNITGLSPNYSVATKPYAGIAIWQAKSDTNVVQFGPSIAGSSTINGNIYAPSAEVNNSFTAATTLNVGAIVAPAFVVAATLSFGGSGGVNLGKLPPVQILTTTLPNATQGQPYTSPAPTATGGDSAYTWSATGLPAWLSIDPATGILSGTPPTSGTVNLTLTASDTTTPNPNTDSQALSLQVISAPTIVSVSPNTGNRGSSQTVTITGTNFVANPTVTFSGTGVTMNNPVVGGGGTTITGTVTVAVNATLNARNLTVTNADGGTANLPNAFTVGAAPTATVTGVSPTSVTRTASNRTITVTGTNFITGATVNISGNGLTLSNQTFVNSTTLTVRVSVSNTATTGGRTVTVTNGDGTAATGSATLTINPVPTILNVQLVNHAGGTADKIEQGDQIVVTFSAQMDANTICSTWPDGTADRTLTNASNQVTVTNGTGFGATDKISNVVAGGCAFQFGTIDLKSNAWVTANVTFGTASGQTTYAWSAAGNSLTITLGAPSNAGSLATVSGNTAPVYSSDNSIVDPSGVGVSNTTFTLTSAKWF